VLLGERVSSTFIADGNYYPKSPVCGIGYHGDTERRCVIAFRFGREMPLCYQWYLQGNAVGSNTYRGSRQVHQRQVYLDSSLRLCINSPYVRLCEASTLSYQPIAMPIATPIATIFVCTRTPDVLYAESLIPVEWVWMLVSSDVLLYLALYELYMIRRRSYSVDSCALQHPILHTHISMYSRLMYCHF